MLVTEYPKTTTAITLITPTVISSHTQQNLQYREEHLTIPHFLQDFTTVICLTVNISSSICNTKKLSQQYQ